MIEIDEFTENLDKVTTKMINVHEMHPVGKDEIHFTDEEEFMKLEPAVIMVDREGNKWTFGNPDTWYVLRNPNPKNEW